MVLMQASLVVAMSQLAAGAAGPGAGACGGTAYVGLLSVHNSTVHSTSLATDLAKARAAGDVSASSRALEQQLTLLLVLARSLRAVESCRRDFVLLGVLPALPRRWQQLLAAEGVTFMQTPPLVLGSPATDKLLAWSLTRYRRLLVLDSDLIVLRPVEDLFQSAHPFVVAHHESDLQQARCGVPLEQRMIGALYAITPSEATLAALRAALPRFVAEADLWQRYAEQQLLSCHFQQQERGVGLPPPSRLPLSCAPRIAPPLSRVHCVCARASALPPPGVCAALRLLVQRQQPRLHGLPRAHGPAHARDLPTHLPQELQDALSRGQAGVRRCREPRPRRVPVEHPDLAARRASRALQGEAAQAMVGVARAVPPAARRRAAHGDDRAGQSGGRAD